MDEMNPGQQDAVKKILGYLAGGALGGGAAALGAGALRNANPRYNPPEPAKPVIVDIPYPVTQHVAGPIPVPRKTRELAAGPQAEAEKMAGLGDIISEYGGKAVDWLHSKLPTVRHPMGPVDAQTARDIPLSSAATFPAAAAGIYGGYRLGDSVTRAIERRRAQAELDEARSEYQEAVNDRASKIYFPKAAADFAALLAGGTPTDPNLVRAKAALDVAWEKRADPQPAPAAAPGDLSRGMTPGEGLTLAALYPWTAMGERANHYGMAAMGGLTALGGYMGYKRVRDAEAARTVRDAVEQRDRANARSMSSPVIARLVPAEQPA